MLEQEFAGMKAFGWQITEEPIRANGPYNTRPAGWRVTACLNGIVLIEEAPSLSQAREQAYERVRRA